VLSEAIAAEREMDNSMRKATVTYQPSLFSWNKIRLTSLNHDNFDGTVVVTMVAMGMVKTTIHQKIVMIPMGNPFVAAIFVVLTTACEGTTFFWVQLGYFDSALVPVTFMLMMEMTVVNVINVVVVSGSIQD
jgi:hypothetical protein